MIETIRQNINSTFDRSLFDEFFLYVGQFKMNHENKVIIEEFIYPRCLTEYYFSTLQF